MLKHAGDPLELVHSAFKAGSILRFGDALRLLRTSDSSALSTAPPGCAVEVESNISRALADSGREHRGFLAVTAIPPARTVTSTENVVAAGRRSVWEIYRANPLDGFAGDQLHYGQLFRLGQRASTPEIDGDEVLLSCEPPAGDGGQGSPYMILGRRVIAGYPDPRIDSRKSFSTVFRVLPAADPNTFEGLAVDLHQPVILVPAAPAAYVHEPRFLQVAPGLAGHGTSGQMVKMAEGRELAVEAAIAPAIDKAYDPKSRGPGVGLGANADGPHPVAKLMWWSLERLSVREGATSSCDRLRAQAHHGLPRALLGRALEVAPPCVRGAQPSSHLTQETQYALWERTRCSLLPRLFARGNLALCSLRKALAAHGESSIRQAELSVDFRQSSDDSTTLAELCVPVTSLEEVLRCDCGIHLAKGDIALIAHAFAAAGCDGRIDADLFVDALRGEVTPGREACIVRMYAQLQQDAGLRPSECLFCEYISSRLHHAVPAEVSGQRTPDYTPQEVMGVLQIRRTHTGLPRAAFLRWISDLTFHLPRHGDFAEAMTAMWGLPLQVTPKEVRLWSLHDVQAGRLRPTPRLPWDLPRPWSPSSTASPSPAPSECGNG